MSPYRFSFLAWSALALGGCWACPPKPTTPEPGPEAPAEAPPVEPAPLPDAGVEPDAGPHYTANYAGEACPPELFLPGAGPVVPEGATPFGLCIALRLLSGQASLNGQPAAGEIQLELESGDARGNASLYADGAGHYELKVMRSRYDALRYHPSGIFPTHAGPEDFGLIDLRQDRTKDLAVKSWVIRGNASFGSAPWLSSTTPPDVQLGALGLPPAQAVAATSQAGAYEVALLEGTFSLVLSVPRAALGETELIAWPVSLATILDRDANIDLNVPANQLAGSFTVDGAPFPVRRPGFDYTLEYVAAGGSSPVARTSHAGGVAELHALVPSDHYSVLLSLEAAADAHLPSEVFQKQLTAGLDLTHDATASFALNTFRLEAALGIDGVPATAAPGAAMDFYAGAYASPAQPAFLAYYRVPREGPTFNLRAFPATYYFALYLDTHYRPDLADGWYVVDPQLEVSADRQLPIDIWTAPLDGRLTVDGQPAPSGKPVGWLTLSSQGTGTFRRHVVTAGDGSFHLRVPRGTYDVYFEVDPDTFPEYATGLEPMRTALVLELGQVVDLDYRTVAFAGPLRVGGDVVPDRLPGLDEVGLRLRRVGDGASFHWGFQGGAANYVLRLPPGQYLPTFEIARDALPGVAYGHASLGVKLVAK